MQTELKILAVDTATRCCSAAVRVGDRLAAEMTVVSEQTHSAHLMTMIRETLRMASVALPAIDGLAVSIGPGSFTGLRIGISTIQGLAFAGGKPCVGVSSLEVLAGACLPWPQGLCALMDARKGEVYAGYYRERAGRLDRSAPERVLPIEHALRAIDRPFLFVGDGAERYHSQIRSILGELAGFAPPDRNLPRAATVAWLAQPLLAAKAGQDAGSLVPRYLRAADAELHLRSTTSGRVVPEA